MRKKTEPSRLEVIEGTEPFRTLNLLGGPGANVDEMILCAFTKSPNKKESSHENKDSVDSSTSKKEKSESRKRKISDEKDELINEENEDLDNLTTLDNVNGSMSTPNSVKEKQSRRYSSRIAAANRFIDQDRNVSKKTKKKISISTPKRKSSTKNFKSYLKNMNSDSDEMSPSKKRKISNEKKELIKEKYEDLDNATTLDNVNGSISTPNSVKKKQIRRSSSKKGRYRKRDSKGQFVPADKDKRKTSPQLNSSLISERKQSPKKNCSVSFNLTENSDTLTSQNNMNGNISTSNNVEEKQIRASRISLRRNSSGQDRMRNDVKELQIYYHSEELNSFLNAIGQC